MTGRSTRSVMTTMSQRTTTTTAQARARSIAEGKAGDVKPHGATTIAPATRSDHLYRLEKSLNSVVRPIAEALRKGEEDVVIDLAMEPRVDAKLETDHGDEVVEDSTRYTLALPEKGGSRPVGMADLQRWKRQFLAINRNLATVGTAAAGSPDRTVQVDSAKRLFCDFLATRLSDDE